MRSKIVGSVLRSSLSCMILHDSALFLPTTMAEACDNVIIVEEIVLQDFDDVLTTYPINVISSSLEENDSEDDVVNVRTDDHEVSTLGSKSRKENASM